MPDTTLGCSLVLTTASDRLWAQRVAEHLGIFDSILASDGQENLRNQAKLEAIERYCRQYGFREFAYIGDAPADLPIWRRASQVYVVEPYVWVLRRLERIGSLSHVFGPCRSPVQSVILALRPMQWIKNFLLFVPLLLAHELGAYEKFLSLMYAFLAFSACSSSVYIINDLLDLKADRLHPKKRMRPFASGALPLAAGPPLAVGLFTFSILLSALTLSWGFVGVLLLYFALTTTYSLWLKRRIMADVLMLGGLYTLRVFAGGTAADVLVSEWLLTFSVFLFTSLAFAKRYSELLRLSAEGKDSANGRGYVVADLSLVENMGITSGYIAVLVFALYINSDAVKRVYVNVAMLWLICPLLLYWLGRIWFAAKRQELREDPLVFAVQDRTSFVVVGIAVMLVLLAAA